MKKIGIIGLGYVGLPLAIEFGKQKDFETIGFDVNAQRVADLIKGNDKTGELSRRSIKNSKNLSFSKNSDTLKDLDYYIVTVPTPITKNYKPDYSSLKSACKIVGSKMKKGSIIIFESTVNPGATEEICAPIIERASKMKWKDGFNIGYSPERIVPGSKTHTLINIDKIVAGDTPKTQKIISDLYKKILSSNIISCSSIKVAEAAKVIENTQRDLNIAFFNELSNIFNRLDIDTSEVIEAAATKWNFLRFEPGLVGGHCLSVDPYYLIDKSISAGYYPELIAAGRKTNENLAKNITQRLVNLFPRQKSAINVAIFGLTFKENCTDTRNSKSFLIGKLLSKNKTNKYKVSYFDHLADSEKVLSEYSVNIKQSPPASKKYDLIIFLAPHSHYVKNHLKIINSHLKKNGVIFDQKNILSKSIKSKYRTLGI